MLFKCYPSRRHRVSGWYKIKVINKINLLQILMVFDNGLIVLGKISQEEVVYLDLKFVAIDNIISNEFDNINIGREYWLTEYKYNLDNDLCAIICCGDKFGWLHSEICKYE